MDGNTMREIERVASMRDAIALRSDYPSLGKIEMTYGVEFVKKHISANMIYIANIMGLEFNEFQVEDAIRSVLMIRWMTVVDFKAFLEFCKAQKFYRRDYKEFLDAFQSFTNGILDAAEGDQIAEHNSRKAGESQFGSRENRPLSLKDIYGF